MKIKRVTLIASAFVSASVLVGSPAIAQRTPTSQAASAYRPGAAEAATTRFVEVNGARLAYRVFGRERTGVAPLVLLQRFRGTMDDWDPLFLNRVAAQRRVILFDNTGVGESGGATPPTLERQADDASAFLSAIGVRSADVLGWSMGGMTAQILAAKHPAQVRRLVLVGTLPAGGSPEVSVTPGQWSQVAAKPAYTDQDILFLFFSPTADGVAAGRESMRRTSYRKPATRVGTSQATMGAQYAGITGFFKNEGDWYGKLKTIRVPALVVNGDEDGAFPAINSAVLAREIPDSDLVIYPDAGHGAQHQYGDRFAGDLLSFLNK